MSEYVRKERPLPLDDSWDVVVVGGGPAGCAAAAAAARDGAKTLLVEATSCLGGMGTAGLVTCWCPFSDGEKMIYRGIAEKVFTATKAGMPHIDDAALDWVALDPELLKRIYDDLVTDAGAEVRFNTSLAAVEMADAATVSTLILSSKSGLTACRAKVYVDCTGDADLAAWAGCEFSKGDETGEMQPATLCFMLANADGYAYTNGLQLWPDTIKAMRDSGRYDEIPDTHFCNSLIGPSVVGFNAGHLWDVDNTEPRSTSKALMQGRKLADAIRRGLTEFAPASFGSAWLAQTAALIGIRETRRIVGDYVLTLEDYMARRSFADEIGRNSYPIDIHTSKAEVADHSKAAHSVMDRYENYKPGESHGIPYRCLTPKGLANVLVAGRSVSTDRVVQGSTRVMPVCLVMGEAAGAAAVMTLETADVHAVDTDRLRARLRDCGAYLPE